MDLEILKIAADTKNHKIVKNFTHISKLKNNMCGDEMEVSLKIKNNKVNIQWVNKLAHDVLKLRKNNTEIIIVTSGAIALGCKFLKINRKNLKLKEFQAVAAIGQIELINLFKKAFKKKKVKEKATMT